MTLDILICSLDKGIVRVEDVLMPVQKGIHYIVSYQYTDERFLELIPSTLSERPDVSVYKYRGQGLSANRNLAMEKATADLVMFADDDTRYTADTVKNIVEAFGKYPDTDIAFFRISTYTGRSLKAYPEDEREIMAMPESYSISAIEMVCRRNKVQGHLRYDERFGLGTKFLTCGEEEIWFEDALRQGLKMRYLPLKIAETSTMLKKNMIYVDAGVQRSRGAFTYYMHGNKAWWICSRFALHSAMNGMCHFWPMMKHLAEGIRYMQRTT